MTHHQAQGEPDMHQGEIATLEELDFGSDDFTRLTFHAPHGSVWMAGDYLLTPVAVESKPSQAQGDVIPRFANGRCSDLKLFQQVSDEICQAIMAKNPDFRGKGLTNATNAVIDLLDTYFTSRLTSPHTTAAGIETLADRVAELEKALSGVMAVPAVRQVLGTDHTDGCGCPWCLAHSPLAGGEIAHE